MNTHPTARPPTVLSALGESAAALIAQSAVTMLGFIDAYFMAKMGVATLATVSYVNGFVILVNATVAGALQALLIIGGGRLGAGDPVGFSKTVRSAAAAGALLCAAAQLVVIAVIAIIPVFSSSAPRAALMLAAFLLPGMLLNGLCLVFRLKAMLLKSPTVLIAMALSLVVTRVVALNAVFPLQSGSSGMEYLALAGCNLVSAAICLLVSWFLDRWRFGKLPLSSEAAISAADIKRVLRVGLPIGCVIVLEMSVLGLGQAMQTLLGATGGAAFGLVIQATMLAETIAVALGQVTTINVSLAANRRDRVALTQAVTVGIASTASTHAALAAIAICFPEPIVFLMLPHRLIGEQALVEQLTNYLRYGAGCQLLLAMVVCLASILRGLDDLEHPLLTIALNYLGLGVALSAVLAYLTPLRDLGVWIGIAVSLISSVSFLGLRVRKHLREREPLE
jgi:multidrug resistance protein, MATE family